MPASIRQRQAQMTQGMVMDATYRLLVDEGYGRTTIAAVAHAAGVAVPTIYKAFGTKAELVKRLYDRTLVGDDAPQALGDRPEAATILAERDPRSALKAYAELGAGIATRIGPLLAVLVAARSTDPTLEAFVATIEGERLRANAHLAQHLETLGGLVLPTETARDILWLFTAPDIHHRLVQQRGWTAPQFAGWLAQTLCDQLLGPQPVS